MGYSYPTLTRTSGAGPARNRPARAGIEITLKPDKVVFGDFPVPALLVSGEAEGPVAVPAEARPRQAMGERMRPEAPLPRRRRPPRMPEPIYALLRRMAVEIVCCGFVGIAVLAIGYRLARTALH